MDDIQNVLVLPGDQEEFTTMENSFETGGGSASDSSPQCAPNFTGGDWLGRLVPGDIAIRNSAQDFPVTLPQSWLYGKATLQQTGQCIGAELEVAMLCMQKRLGKVTVKFCHTADFAAAIDICYRCRVFALLVFSSHPC